MRRRRRISRTKTRRRKPSPIKRHLSSTSRHRVDHDQNQANELQEAREQQTATAAVLKVISSSTFDLQTVLYTLVETATRLCKAKRGLLFRREGETYRSAAYFGYSREFREFHESHPITPGRATAVGRTALEGKTIHIPDVLADPEYTILGAQKLGQYRANLAVPLLRGGKQIGALSLARLEPVPFSDKQIELVETFAAQGVIAIENTRLLNELRQRTDALTESLEQQTATSEVLRIISSSPGRLEPVFAAMLQNSVKICEAGFGQMFLCEGDNVRLVAAVGVPTVLVEFDKQRGTFQPSPGGGLDGVMRTKQVVHIADLLSEHASYPPTRLGGARSYIAVPMLKENKLVGAIAIYRQEVRPFTDKQIDLVKNFAAQAVIAIENTRLLNELRQRTADLSKSLEELRTTQDRLVQTQKLALLGQLTAGIAHEIKNPLNFVNNFSGISAELIGELQAPKGHATRR